MNVIFRFLMGLAGLGLLLACVVHIMALAGIPIPGGEMVFALHGGVFIVFLPAFFVIRPLQRGGRRTRIWRTALGGCPVWMRRGLIGLFAYAVVNFIFCMATMTRQPHPHGGEGSTDSQATPKQVPSTVVRAFSGHWMIFYAGAFCIFYSRIKAPHLFRRCKCPNGHEVEPGAKFCPECGMPMAVEPKPPSSAPTPVDIG